MKKFYQYFTISSLLLIIGSCSTKKDGFTNRAFHSVTAKYNVLFNGEQAYKEGIKQIEEKYEDNFWKRLPIEAITFDENKIAGPNFKSFDDQGNLKGQTGTPFDKAEEKAVKAIQKHSINIKGYEKNNQIDDAYLLLGKSRYYTQRFIPAIEAFNYIIANYPDANLNYQSRVWRAKANTRLGNEKTAIETMMLLLNVLDEKEGIPKRMQEEAYTAMAMAYAQTDTITKVISNLKKATKTNYNKEQTARNMFVLGQIYGELNQKDSARYIFKKLANTRTAPDKYRIHANIEIVKNSSKDSSDILLIKKFKKLIRNSDNRKYYNELYYQIGTLYEGQGYIEKAKESFEKSLRVQGSDYQKTYTYQKLGDLNFKRNNYSKAGAYYDSVLQVVPKQFITEKRIRQIKRKNKALTALNNYEEVVKENDSILKIVNMPLEKQQEFFETYIEKIKKEDQERRQQLANSQNFGSSVGSKLSFGVKSKGKWYFYNNQTKQFGLGEFERIWGNRPLEDNWRWSDKNKINSNTDNEEEDNIQNTKRYDINTYLNAIPKDQDKIDQLRKEREDALYQLGLRYKEQFNDYQKAIKNLERLDTINTNQDLKLPTAYHLYQLYETVNNTAKKESIKKVILEQYPFSTYASIINSPEKKITNTPEKKNTIERKYKEIYRLYKKGEYNEVINQVNSYSQQVNKSDLIPKFALVKALAIGKTQSKEEYIKALDFIAFSYANTIEGKKAKEILTLLKK